VVRQFILYFDVMYHLSFIMLSVSFRHDKSLILLITSLSSSLLAGVDSNT